MKVTRTIAMFCLFSVFAPAVLTAARPEIRRAARPVTGSYIVLLKASTQDNKHIAADLTARHGGGVQFVYEHALKGFSVKMTERQAEAMLRDPRIEAIEEDSALTLQATTQSLPSFEWYFLDRIDQRQRGFTAYGYQPAFTYCQNGTGVKAYVIDTGVWAGHNEFWTGTASRVTAGFDLTYAEDYKGTASDPCPSLSGQCEPPAVVVISHGTAVASLIGGKTAGVAKNVTIVPVRVFGCSGDAVFVSSVLWGIDAVINDHQAGTPAVANMSFAETDWSYSNRTALATAVNNLIDDGVTVVAAAGNQNEDAAFASPANIPRVITVGGTDNWDGRWVDPTNANLGSNYGATIDIFAPASVESASIWGCQNNFIVQDAYAWRTNTKTGTSFSAALVTGVVAQYLQLHPTATPAQVETWLKANATTGAIKTTPSLLGSPNLLVYSYCQ